MTRIETWRRIRRGFVLPFCMLLSPFGMSARAETVTVFAASSLKSAVDEIAQSFEKASSVDLTISYAGSSLLARQILQGAPADVFMSANQQWMQVVVDADLSASDVPYLIASNNLVLVGKQSEVGDFSAPEVLTGNSVLLSNLTDAHIAMGFVNAVPVGQYGKAALSNLGYWERVSEHVVQTDNARAALALVALGEVPYGIVYETDARAEPRVHMLGFFPHESHPKIEYSATQITGASPSALDFLEYLTSDAAQAIFKSHGFVPLSRASDVNQ